MNLHKKTQYLNIHLEETCTNSNMYVQLVAIFFTFLSL